MTQYVGDPSVPPGWNGSNFHVDGERVEVPSDADPGEVVERLKGRTIVAAAVELREGEWPQGNGIFIRLDDGTVVEFSGWGYDAWGTDARFWWPPCP